jgi:hypothetical protein
MSGLPVFVDNLGLVDQFMGYKFISCEPEFVDFEIRHME